MDQESQPLRICISLVALALSLCGFSTGLTPSTKPPAIRSTVSFSELTAIAAVAETSSDVCLGCHGPFTKLASALAQFVAEDGNKINPHVYVPHDKQEIPGCTNCHTPHPVPLTSPKGLSKPAVDYCYNTCHHRRNFTPCKTCH